MATASKDKPLSIKAERSMVLEGVQTVKTQQTEKI
jgi:hypothetical protein